MKKVRFLEAYNLNEFNTLRLDSIASGFAVLDDVTQLEQISELITSKSTYKKLFVLGGGSNIILPAYYDGLVIYNKLKGIEVGSDDGSGNVKIRVASGVGWDYFVAYTLAHELFGLENLSLIPGTVGAAPIQNIGAYGVEVKDYIEYVDAYHVENKKIVRISNQDCQFAYRNSIFKHAFKDKYIITHVGFKLLKKAAINCSYEEVKHKIASLASVNNADMRRIIIEIRTRKLPDPALIGNVGSFFKNVVMPYKQFRDLQQKVPLVHAHKVDGDQVKVSSGWLIDNLGLKGYRVGNFAIYEKQALVIVNYVADTVGAKQDNDMNQLLKFVVDIQSKILSYYGIELEIEPLLIT